MQAQGINQSDPKFQKLLAIYRNYSAHVGTPSSAALSSHGGLPEASMNQAAAKTLDSHTSVPSSSARGANGPFTMEQLQQLRAQILAYKYISRNMALPTALLAAIRNPGSVKKETLGLDQSAPPQEDRLRRLQTPTALNAKTGTPGASASRKTGTATLILLVAVLLIRSDQSG
jgi:hypothetical protein